MEASFLFCKLYPSKFAELLTEFMLYGGPHKIIYSSAAVNPHPQVVLDAFAGFTMPSGSPIPLSDEIRAMILGGTLAASRRGRRWPRSRIPAWWRPDSICRSSISG